MDVYRYTVRQNDLVLYEGDYKEDALEIFARAILRVKKTGGSAALVNFGVVVLSVAY